MRALRTVAASVLVLSLVAACGDDDGTSKPPTFDNQESASEGELGDLMLTLDDVPTGYVEVPDTDDEVTYICDYEPSVEPDERAKAVFAKDNAEILGLAAGRFPSEGDAETALDDLDASLDSCTSMEIEGEEVEIARMKIDDVGYPAVGVQMTFTETGPVMVYLYAQVGDSLVQSGAGGIFGGDLELATEYLVKQIEKYESAS